jgi:hypothetical protein
LLQASGFIAASTRQKNTNGFEKNQQAVSIGFVYAFTTKAQ